jgi:glycosyltransferase involved in cell wall biosynthesis
MPRNWPIRPILSVVIPTIDREGLLDQALKSISDSLGSAYPVEFIVVDSSVPPIRLYIARGHGEIIHSDERFTGAGKPINLGCQASQGRYVAILNDDMVIEGQPLSEAVEIMERDPQVGQVAIPWWNGNSGEPRISALGNLDFEYANFGVTRRVLGDQAGWWGEYRHFYGDPHLTCSILAQGYTMAIAKRGSVKHAEAPSYFRGLADQWKSAITSMEDHLRFMQQWGHMIDGPKGGKSV